jgi:methyltransferase (TIGR00027 family)
MDPDRTGRWPWLRRRPEPSRTSQAVAAVRAQMPRPHTPGGDPEAQGRISAGMRPAGAPAVRARLAARTRFFDEQVIAALDRGISQVVIVGAGYDDRALRFRSPGVRYFELDHPATQADKRRRLRAMKADETGLTLLAADFRTDDAAGVLARSRHHPGRPSLFLCEGLLVYLDQQTSVELLSALRSRAAEGSLLAVSLAIHRDGLDSAAVVARANAGRAHAASEPWRTILPASSQRRLLAEGGWVVAAATDDAAAGGRESAAQQRRSLLVTAQPGPGHWVAAGAGSLG